MADIIKQTLKEIEDKKIAPKPKWHHSFRDYAFWFIFALSIILGAIATSTIIYLLVEHDWDVYRYLHRNPLEYIFTTLPYLWFVVVGLLIFSAFSQVKNTKSGYKYSPYLVVILSVILSLVLGVALFHYALDFGINDFLSAKVPIYNNLVCAEKTVWNNVGAGLLNGEVISIASDDEFTLKDCNGKIWQVQYDESQWLEKIPLRVGMKIKLVGVQQGNNTFIVKIIRPLEKLRPLPPLPMLPIRPMSRNYFYFPA